jgi:predicted RNA-binding protein (virulence factor B family)
MQGPHHAREQHGTVEMKVIGRRDDKQVALSLTDLQAGASADHGFTFRYFDNLKGSLTLPEGFDPERIEVTLRQGHGSDDAVTREFDWRAMG